MPLGPQVVGSAVGDDKPLMSAGLDSLGSVEFANVLSQKLGMQASGWLAVLHGVWGVALHSCCIEGPTQQACAVACWPAFPSCTSTAAIPAFPHPPPLQMPGTLIFDYPSVRAVTEYLTAQMLKSAAAAAAAAGAAAAATGAASVDEEWAGGELSVEGGLDGSAVAASQWAHRQRHVAVLAVVARPLMAEAAELQASAGRLNERIGWTVQGLLAMHAQGDSCARLREAAHPCLPTLQAAGPAGTADAIHRVPLERWDLDQAEALQGDTLTLAAQVGR